MKRDRFDAVGAVEDAPVVLLAKERDEGAHVGHGGRVVPDVRHRLEAVYPSLHLPVDERPRAVGEDPPDPRIALGGVLLEVAQVLLVSAPGSGQVHRHPQSQFAGDLHLLVGQELVDAAVLHVPGDGVEAVHLQADEAPLLDVALDLFGGVAGHRQPVPAREGIGLHLPVHERVVAVHVGARGRSSQHEEVGFPSRQHEVVPCFSRREAGVGIQVPVLAVLGDEGVVEQVHVAVVDPLGHPALQLRFPDFLVVFTVVDMFLGKHVPPCLRTPTIAPDYWQFLIPAHNP